MVRRCWLLVALAAGLLALIQTHAGDAKKDRERLQGTWQVVEFRSHGQSAPEEVRKAMKLTFVGDTIKASGLPVGERNFKFKLDPGKKPKAIDLIPQDGPGKGKSGPGIYEVDGDVLKLCIPNKDGIERPKEFQASADTYFVLFVLKR